MGIATALEPIAVEIPNLQITSGWNSNPTPPSIDIYPADPFQDYSTFGLNAITYWTVRARVSMADEASGQETLLRLLDPTDPASVEGALGDTATKTPEGVSGFRTYSEDSGTPEQMLGCEWRVRVYT